MLATNINQETTRIQRLHLQARLQQRARSAQANPDLLSLLASEARDLGIELETWDAQSATHPAVVSSPTRLDRTLTALKSLRVDHH